MAQVSLSNVSLSFLKEQYNITDSISFSELYKYSTDISVYDELSISELIGKFRTFLPTDLSGIINWYDATSLILENVNNNDNISILKDLSGNNNNAIQTTADNQPSFQKYGLNGKPSILFIDNTLTNSKYLNFTSSISPTKVTIAVVFNTSSSRNNYIFSTSTWKTGNILFNHNTGKYPNISINTTTNNNNTYSSIYSLDFLPKLYIIKYYIDSSDGNTKSQLRYNGIDGSIYTHDNSLLNLVLGNMTLGGTSSGYTNNLHGNISEFILYDRLLSNNEIYILEGYLASKWWGVPSYLLPSTHKFYNIPVLNTINSPSLLYTFEDSTHTSNVNILRNYGLEGNLLDGIVKNFDYSTISTYYIGFNNHVNTLFIWYKFDSTGNLIYENNGFGGSIYDLVNPGGKVSYTLDYMRGDGSLSLSPSEISTTNTTTNLINFNSFSSEYTFSFWYKVVALIGSSDTLLSLSGAPNSGSEFYIQRETTTNNLIISIPNQVETIKINNAIFNDNTWRHISVCLKQNNTNDLIISVYLNGIVQYSDHTIIGGWFGSATNYLVINQYATGSGIYSGFGGNMLYDDFRIYTKYLNEKESQAIMGYPITLQSGVRNTNSYVWNTYSSSITSVIDIDYTSFINYFFVDGNTYTISYNLQILNDALYTSDFELTIIHCNDNNLDKLKIVHRFFNSSTDYIKIIISDTTTNNVTQYFENTQNDNNIHNYIFIIPISLYGSNVITLYTDGKITNNAAVTSSEPIINDRFVRLGIYNDSVATLNTSPMSLEDFKIYTRELQLNEIHYINSNYNLDSDLLFYESNIFPFNYIKFTDSYAESNAYGPTYSNLIINYSSNGSWVFNLDYFNSYNGIQQFTIPQSGYYKITTAGAAGGASYTETNFGKGIVVTNITYLNANDILNILVGQKGADGGYVVRINEHDLHGQGGGGGGSYVALSNIPILVAGGGGGSGETMNGGENAIGVNAVYTTYSSSDSGNYSVRAVEGNGGEIGIFGASRGSGCGGGGFYTDGKNKISIYNGEYKGYSYLNYLNNSNIGKPFNLNVGGIGGFPGGATGGTNYSLDLVWGGGGGSGYSGGPGGSASYYQGQTLGGGGGGSFDICGIQNHATINKQEATLGYNSGNGYVKLQFLTSDNFLEYTNANDRINRNGLTLLIEPYNSFSYDSFNIPTAMTNLVDGTYAYLNDSYSYNSTNNSIRLYNTSQYEDMNLSYLHINSHSEIRTLSIWYIVLSPPTDNTFLLDSFENFGYINEAFVGADWFNSLRDIGSDEGGKMYVNSSNEIKNINWNDIVYPLNTWRNITLISHSNLTNDLSIFANSEGYGGMNVEFGPIMVYNQELTLDQHIANYNIYGQIYNTPFEFYFIGSYQYFVVPDNVFNVQVKIWSSGGGGSREVSGNGYGGSGTHITTVLSVVPREKLTITVPSGGFAALQSSRSSGGWPNGSIGGYESGGGGGFTSIQRENGEYMIIAASGAGAGYFYGTYDAINTVSYVQSQTCGGGGGDLTSGNAPTIESGNPGTSSMGGLAYTTLFNNTVQAGDGGYLIGGDGGTNFGGGGGNGLYGGSGGGERQDFVAGGASGSSYCNPLYCKESTIIAGNNGNISNGEAPNNTDINYPGSQIGDGGPAGGNNGRNGYVLIKVFY